MSTPRYEVIPSRVWKHAGTGQSVSIYGALPYQSAAEAKEWSIVDVGFTIRDNVRSTVGIGRVPFETAEEAQKVADDMMSRLVRPASA